MPLVEISGIGMTKDQKKEIARKVVDTIAEITGKDTKYFTVIFRDVAASDWAVAGELLG